MAEPKAKAKINTAALVKLLEVATELHTRTGDVIAEMDAILAGKAGMAAKLKAVEEGFDAAWCSRYAPGRSKVYVWTYVRDRPQIKRLLKAMTLEDVVERAGRYVRSEDGFFVRSRHNFGLFVSSINQWAPATAGPGELDLEAAPADCKHEPACQTDAEHTRRRTAEMRS